VSVGSVTGFRPRRNAFQSCYNNKKKKKKSKWERVTGRIGRGRSRAAPAHDSKGKLIHASGRSQAISTAARCCGPAKIETARRFRSAAHCGFARLNQPRKNPDTNVGVNAISVCE
jgi:hypothetical protein